MSYKNGGLKAKYYYEYGAYGKTYTVYTALESVSDYNVYIMVDEDGNVIAPTVGEEDDCVHGCHSLIDVLYYLKHHNSGTYCFEVASDNIVIEEMTDEEMNKYFRNK